MPRLTFISSPEKAEWTCRWYWEEWTWTKLNNTTRPSQCRGPSCTRITKKAPLLSIMTSVWYKKNYPSIILYLIVVCCLCCCQISCCSLSVSCVALLQLAVTDRPYCAKETRFVKTACLPGQSFPSGSECVISGWGATETRKYQPNPDPQIKNCHSVISNDGA